MVEIKRPDGKTTEVYFNKGWLDGPEVHLKLEGEFGTVIKTKLQIKAAIDLAEYCEKTDWIEYWKNIQNLLDNYVESM